MTQTADQILREAADAIQQRAALRDLPQGERSMARAVAIFAAATGQQLSELEGWTFMICLKMARASAGARHLDDYTDLAGYAALAGECLFDADQLTATISAPAEAEPAPMPEAEPTRTPPERGEEGFLEYCTASKASVARSGEDCFEMRCTRAMAHHVLNCLMTRRTIDWCRINTFYDGLFFNIYLGFENDRYVAIREYEAIQQAATDLTAADHA